MLHVKIDHFTAYSLMTASYQLVVVQQNLEVINSVQNLLAMKVAEGSLML